jgi:hypothetical protein
MNVDFPIIVWVATLLLLAVTVFLNTLKREKQALLTGFAALIVSFTAFILVIVQSGHLPMSGTFEKMQNIVLIIVLLGLFNSLRKKEKRISSFEFWIIALVFQALVLFDEMKVDEFFYLYENLWVAMFFQFRLISMAFVAYSFSLYLTALRANSQDINKSFIIRRAGFYTLAGAILFLCGEFSGSVWAQLGYGDTWRWSKNFFTSGGMFLLALVGSHLSPGWIKTANRQIFLSIFPLVIILLLFIF